MAYGLTIKIINATLQINNNTCDFLIQLHLYNLYHKNNNIPANMRKMFKSQNDFK